MVWRTAERGRLIAMIFVSITILFLAIGLPVTADGSTDGTTFKVIATTPVGMGPRGIAYDPSNGYIYVTNFLSNTVWVINGATNTFVTIITVGFEPEGVAYDPSNGYIYVANSLSDTVSIIATSVSTTSTPSAVPTWAVKAVAVVVVVVLIAALLAIKRRKP